MFWIFTLIIGGAFMLIKLGALMVMFSIMSLLLKAALIVIVLLCVMLIWRKLFKVKGS